MKFYPLQFETIFKEKIWGGNKLQTFLHKNLPSNNIGESWELSTVEDSISVVKNGFFQGKNLQSLVEEFSEDILGKKVFATYGKQFPLLFKFIDAKEDLSIQVHPNDALAKKRHNSFGKTEMWYILEADEDARIIVGFQEKSSKNEYMEQLQNKNLLSILKEIKVKKGDIFLLETGTIHAIGAGILLAEIQQTSDITYRVYDWDRVDVNGNERELHIDLALDAINYNSTSTQKEYEIRKNETSIVVNCPYFTTSFLPLDGHKTIKKTNDSFMVLMCTEGSFTLKIDNKNYDYTIGETIFLPAILTSFDLIGKATILEIVIS